MKLPGNISEYYLTRLEQTGSEESTLRQKLISVRSVYNDFLKELVKNEPQLFSSNFAAAVFIFDKYSIPENLVKRIGEFRKIIRFATSSKTVEINNLQYSYCKRAVNDFICFFDESKSAEDFSVHEEEIKYSPEIIPVDDNLSRVTVREIIDKDIICETEAGGIARLTLNRYWSELRNFVWKGSVLNLFNMQVVKKNNFDLLQQTEDSLIVLEPDYTIDVTDISGCFGMDGPNYETYFIKKLTDSKVTMKLLLGNVVNFCLDELMLDPDAEFETVYYRALAHKPLQIFSLAAQNKDEVGTLKVLAKSHFDNLKRLLPKIRIGEFSIEPSFISVKYGLQGRLDVMIEFEDDKKRKNIIELKSGSSANVSTTLSLPGNQRIKTGIWNEHYTQTICYNLLLDSAFEGRTGSSFIVYSSDHNNPLRDAPNITQKKQEVMLFRNKIVSKEHSLLNYDFSLFKDLNPVRLTNVSGFTKNDAVRFYESYIRCEEQERAYFHYFLSFLLGENYAARLGAGTERHSSGFCALWQESYEDKEKSMYAITGLFLDADNSDFENYHLRFIRSRKNAVSSLRKNDVIILHPVQENGNSALLNNQILKGYIISIDFEFVEISLRNKIFRRGFFDEYSEWILEPDSIDSTSRIIQSFAGFLKADERKRKILLALREPSFSKKKYEPNPDLNEKQNYVVSQALAAEDYFLIQGPPGTGKTSYVLKEIVRQIFINSDENLLILAYTNRAVDEICSTISKIKEADGDFLRLGGKESSEFKDNLISCLTENMSFQDLFRRIRKTRIFVSTVSSVLTNPEIFEIKTFNTVVIDEASQILEPYIAGIFCKVRRFIMIGDEKQLPAIVLQDDSRVSNQNEGLKSIGIRSFGSSLFERLLTECMKNYWHTSYAMLNDQARMHLQIQTLINTLFYSDKLKVINEWQKSEGGYRINPESKYFHKAFENSRVVFVESPKENFSKVNFYEVDFVVALIKHYSKVSGNEFNENTIGIISPFRAQCAEILKAVPEEIKPVVAVDTVERFQGSEREIIIISLATNHEYLLKSIQSAMELDGKLIDRKLNVAMTRARQQIVILGNSSVLASSEIYHRLIYIIKQQNGYINFNEAIELLNK